MAGRFFDEWGVGDRIVHEIRRTVTEADTLLFSTMTHNPQPLHLDGEATKASEVSDLKESRSRPNAGIVTFTHRLSNHRDEIVCQCLRSALIQRRPA